MMCRQLLALIPLLCLTHVGAEVHAAPMGLGPDAKQSIEEWSGRLGLDIKSVTLKADHAVLDLGGCSIFLAHESGTRCSGLFMDAGGARACLSSMTGCIEWSDFQDGISKAGAIYPTWQAIEAMPTSKRLAEPGSESELPKDFTAAIAVIEDALLWLEPKRAETLFGVLLARDSLSLAEELSVIPGAARLGLGGQALSRLGSGVWLELDMRLSMIVRASLMMGPHAAVAVADTLLDEASACSAVPIGHAFKRVGDFASAAALGLVIRRRDVKCFEAYALEIHAAYQAGVRQSVADAFYEARARFEGDRRLPDLQLIALKATGQWRAAKYVLDQKIEAKSATPQDFALMARAISQKGLKSEAKIAWKTKLDAEVADPIASFFLGVLAHQEKDYRASYALLQKANTGPTAKVAYLHVLQALNALGLKDGEEAMKAAKRAIELDPKEPAAHWAFAEVIRDEKPLVASRSLDIALALLPHRAIEGVRIKRQRSALDACGGEGPCKGPWRFPGRSAQK